MKFALNRHLRPIDAAHLPLPIGKRDDAETASEPPKKRRPKPAASWTVVYSGSLKQAKSLNWQGQAVNLARDFGVTVQKLARLSGCLKLWQMPPAALKSCQTVEFNQSVKLGNCQSIWQAETPSIRDTSLTHWGISTGMVGNGAAHWAALARFEHELASHWRGSQAIGRDWAVWWRGRQSIDSLAVHWGRSQQPPCDWYPVILPEPTTPPHRRPCGARPVANRLPLHFRRRKVPISGSQLPLPFSCNADFNFIPPLDSYMILNKITAQTDNGIVLNPLSFSAKADMSGYCWSCSMSLSPDDFAALSMDKRELGNEAMITIDINHDRFVFMAENYSNSRQFGKRSYTINGRSETARLGADYAFAQKGTIDRALYVSQIAQQQVADLGYTLDWNVVDWLIPSDTYNLTDKNPIAVVQDLAQAVGGFVYSHPHERKLFVRPRWRVAAWEVNTASPAVIVPSNVILKADGQKNVQTQYYGVFVWGSTSKGIAANCMRQGSDGEPRANALNHCAYTDLQACQAAGVAALSDSGSHQTEMVTLPVMHKYGLGLAEIGRVWQFVELQQAWQGVIVGVDLDVKMSGDVPVIEQRVTVDRYLGM